MEDIAVSEDVVPSDTVTGTVVLPKIYISITSSNADADKIICCLTT